MSKSRDFTGCIFMLIWLVILLAVGAVAKYEWTRYQAYRVVASGCLHVK